MSSNITSPSWTPEKEEPKQYLLRLSFFDECYEEVIDFDALPGWLDGELSFENLWELVEAPELETYPRSREEIMSDLTVETQEILE